MTLNLEKLYNAKGTNLSHAIIERGDGYFDLLDEFGELLAMNGDEVEIVKANDDCITMKNCFDGLRFVLTGREFDVGIVF